MKKYMIVAILGLTTVFATSSFTNAGSVNSSIDNTIKAAPLDGIWTGYFSNSIGTAYYYYSLTFQPDGSLMVEHNGSLGYGTYSMMGDRLVATYMITDVDPQNMKAEGEGDTYSLSGKVSGNNINGTLNGGSNNGTWVFSVNKE